MIRTVGVNVTYYLNSVMDFVTWYAVKFVNLPCVPENSLCSPLVEYLLKVITVFLLLYV